MKDSSAMTRKLRTVSIALCLLGALTLAAAQSAGVNNCANRIDQTTKFLTQGTGSALLFLPERDPDNSMVSISMELQPTGLPRTYASATFSPNTAVGCSVAYESVQYWSEP